jgi:N-acetylglucosamine kinase-like BadF-type ATPase
MGSYLIADSGGTRTNWCFIKANLKSHYFETESYHPDNWSDDFIARIADYWKDHSEMRASKLLFYGAGCLKKSNSIKQECIFKEIGFNNVTVRSDLHAAGIACLGDKSGKVVIMGTGSVLFDWQDRSVQNVIGGKGHESGDEGSGYYFGRLVYNAHLSKKLSEEQNQLFVELVDLVEINNNSKSELSHIAYLLKDHKSVFDNFHRINVKAFYAKHLKQCGTKDIHLLGGYVYHNASIIEEELTKYEVQIVKILKAPISVLVEQIVSLNE